MWKCDLALGLTREWSCICSDPRHWCLGFTPDMQDSNSAWRQIDLEHQQASKMMPLETVVCESGLQNQDTLWQELNLGR